MSVLIKNGTIVNADQSFSADVLCADGKIQEIGSNISCLLYTSPSPRDGLLSRMPSSA